MSAWSPPADGGSPAVDAPSDASSFRVGGTGSVSAICPAFDAAIGCRPVWEFADRNQLTQSVLDGTVESTGSSGPVYRLLCHTLLRPTDVPDSLWRRPRLYAAATAGAR